MREIIHLINEMSPYLLLGFLLAGVMHAFIPSGYYRRFLGRRSFRSVVNAAVLGIPLPLCSCGVIPTAMSLRKEGASKGSTVSFLIATPQTGIDSIIATYSLMGLPFALVRPLAALCTSLLGGALVNAADREGASKACGCGSGDSADATDTSSDGDGASRSCGCGSGDMEGAHCGCGSGDSTSGTCSCGSISAGQTMTFRQKCVEALKYAFVEMMEDIGKWLVVGLVVAGLITVLVPDGWFAIFKGNTLASMLLVLVIAMPMYVCATGSIPIAVALMLKGLTPGAALVLLMAGPACNFASMLVVRKVLGWKTTLVYMLSIVLGAIAFGCGIDWLQASGSVDFLAHLTSSQACCHEPSSWFAWTCTGLLFALLVNALVVSRLRRRSAAGAEAAAQSVSQSTSGTTAGTEVSSNSSSEAAAGSSLRIYHIKGMNCNHCRMSAEKALQSVEGVTRASVDLASKEARVEGTASREQLAKAVGDLGFTLVD